MTKSNETKPCSDEKFVMPTMIPSDTMALEYYLKVFSLPNGKRQKEFSALSDADKADVFKIQLAMNLVKRPYLTKEQQNLILETILDVSADTYSKSDNELRSKADKKSQELENKALSIFPADEAYEIFASMNGDKTTDLDLLKKYEQVLALPTISQRKRKLREMESKEKSLFWKGQMIFYLATAKLSSLQAEFISRTIPVLTPLAFDAPKDKGIPLNDDTKRLDALEAEAFKIFSKPEVFVIFMSPGLHKMAPFRKETDNNIPNPEGDCECNYFCGALCWTCTRAGSCTATTTGCGWYENKPCNYQCILLQNCP